MGPSTRSPFLLITRQTPEHLQGTELPRPWLTPQPRPPRSQGSPGDHQPRLTQGPRLSPFPLTGKGNALEASLGVAGQHVGRLTSGAETIPA